MTLWWAVGSYPSTVFIIHINDILEWVRTSVHMRTKLLHETGTHIDCEKFYNDSNKILTRKRVQFLPNTWPSHLHAPWPPWAPQLPASLGWWGTWSRPGWDHTPPPRSSFPVAVCWTVTSHPLSSLKEELRFTLSDDFHVSHFWKQDIFCYETTKLNKVNIRLKYLEWWLNFTFQPFEILKRM